MDLDKLGELSQNITDTCDNLARLRKEGASEEKLDEAREAVRKAAEAMDEFIGGED